MVVGHMTQVLYCSLYLTAWTMLPVFSLACLYNILLATYVVMEYHTSCVCDSEDLSLQELGGVDQTQQGPRKTPHCSYSHTQSHTFLGIALLIRF